MRPDTFACACAPGYANGTCTPAHGTSLPQYAALCNASAGARCNVDVDECTSTPCLNNGTCVDPSRGSGANATKSPRGQADRFVCRCAAGLCHLQRIMHCALA